MFGGGKGGMLRGMPPGPGGIFGGGKGGMFGGILGPGPPRPMNGGGIPGIPGIPGGGKPGIPAGGMPIGGIPIAPIGPPANPPLRFAWYRGFACPSELYASVILLMTCCVCSLDICS
jgi:hypothetical protein